MSASFQSIRGTYDILPSMAAYWQFVERVLRETAASYNYQEIRFPLLEKTELFTRTIGEVTDIVEKEMYTFADRNGDSLTLRPEGTAGCVRAGIQNGLLYNQLQRLWYMGPMFRHERPQKGRYRQFYQFGVEAFGMAGPDLDAELLLLAHSCWKKLGIADVVTLQLNSLGSAESRSRHKAALVEYFSSRQDQLDEDSKKRLAKNPLRILDSKNPQLQEVIAGAPQLLDYLDGEALEHFTKLREILDAANIKYEVNPYLVRGLDYYCFTVFEWVTEQLGAQGTVCAGGRYDGLVTELGGKPTPAAGFALGLERLLELVKQVHTIESAADMYVVIGEDTVAAGLVLAEELRTAFPHLRLLTNCGGGSFKNQFKRANKSGAKLAVILGENELANNEVSIKYLREDRPQQTVARTELLQILATEY